MFEHLFDSCQSPPLKLWTTRLTGVRRVEHPRFQDAVREVEHSIDQAWSDLRAEFGTTDEQELAELVLQDPTEFDWRVVDGALDRLTCDECGAHLGAGPQGCATCDLANGFRFAAREVDRPNVPPGNEHAIRVASAVARTRHRYSPRARCGYELVPARSARRRAANDS